MTHKLRNILLNGLVVFTSFLFCFLLAEVALYFFPVIDSHKWQEVTEENPLLRHEANSSITYSVGWSFEHANVRKVNNEGFLNDQTYLKELNSPLIGVVGDSYVEAMLNPYEKTFYGRLASYLRQNGSDWRVYSFGISGAPLSQYLAWSDYARKQFKPKILIIPIIANDFDESFYKYKRTRGFHYFDDLGTSSEIRVVERVDSPLRTTLMASRAFRYFFFHLRGGDLLKNTKDRILKLISGDKTPPRYIGNVVARATAKQIADAKLAIDLFLDQISESSGLRPSEIVFVVDAVRPSIYQLDELEFGNNSYWGETRKYFLKKSKNLSFGVIDMQPIFLERYRSMGKRFEYDYDSHWNDYAHEVVFNSLRANLISRGIP